MARVRRNWTPKEDELLRRAVRTAEAQQRPLLWRELAKAVPGRSNKDCRRRWWNSLADGNAKGPWAEEEDERLIAAVQTYGTNWTRVAQEVKSRGSDQCSSHWSHVLDPNINYCDWTEEEDADLLHEVLTYGTRWAHIASCHKPARTTLALKNRYSTLRLKNENRNRSRQHSCEMDAGLLLTAATTTATTTTPGRRPGSDRRHTTPNPSETSETTARQAAGGMDEEEDGSEEDSVAEGDVIHAWLDESRHLNDGAGHHHQQQQQQQLGQEEDPESSLRLGAMHIQVPDVASLSSWDAWAKFGGGLPTPHHAQSSGSLQMSGPEAVGIDVDSYLQLGSPMMLNGQQSTQEPSPLSETCFYSNEDSRPADQTSSYSLHDNTRCRQQTPVSSTSPATLVPTPSVLGSTVDIPMDNTGAPLPSTTTTTTTNPSPTTTTMGGTMGGPIIASHPGGWGSLGQPSNATSCPSPPPSWPQQSPASSSISLGSAPQSKFRVSITTTCDQEQLMNIITQLSQYGTAPSINVQKH